MPGTGQIHRSIVGAAISAADSQSKGTHETSSWAPSCLFRVGSRGPLFSAAFLAVFSVDPGGGGIHSGPAGLRPVQCVEHDKIVDDALVLQRRHIHARHTKLAGVGLALVPQYIRLPVDDHSGGKTSELLQRSAQRRGSDLPAMYFWHRYLESVIQRQIKELILSAESVA